MNRQRRTREQWKAIIARFEQSGLNGSEFCQREGLNPKTFYRAKANCSKPLPVTSPRFCYQFE